ncbi:DUF3313 domain-containing protein [Sphingomonas sp. NSE70-1]|uniref:DUF3313 domain-containing protein n=1 Tax=Sphingomonas caseinilyticus TaxID=2908205 RepID=A0ABT0RTI0_9SPHN|nr:DUF3313 family protein [Sphingomonas caseinilyticus]MCL6698308.1 DUF3313 domain-containing protein [Sphingomonas caseinilyticus]
MRSVKWIVAALALTVGATGAIAKAPATWDGLVQVKSKKLNLAYLLPDADFRAYSKVMFDKPEVAFSKNWQRDFNRSAMTLSGRISDKDVRDAVTQAEESLSKIFPQRFTEDGYQVVNEAGPDVLRLGVAIVNLEVNAPERDIPGRSATYAVDAGEATFAIEARDSLTGQLLGRAVDRREAGEGPTYRRNYTSNIADFEALFDTWARIAARGLTELKAASPVNTDGIRKQ